MSASAVLLSALTLLQKVVVDSGKGKRDRNADSAKLLRAIADAIDTLAAAGAHIESQLQGEYESDEDFNKRRAEAENDFGHTSRTREIQSACASLNHYISSSDPKHPAVALLRKAHEKILQSPFALFHVSKQIYSSGRVRPSYILELETSELRFGFGQRDEVRRFTKSELTEQIKQAEELAELYVTLRESTTGLAILAAELRAEATIWETGAQK